jgi:uncharacterized damage-inducible protein DinB
MPMHVIQEIDERQQLLAFLDQQRQAAVHACYGLSDQQARATSTASPLSLGGLVKHLTQTERQWIARLGDSPAPEEGGDASARMEEYFASFRLTNGETLAGVLEDYREAAAETDAAIAGEPDMNRTVDLPPAPWLPAGSCSVRWILLHLIEEAARHAGHADIIRESLDGATSGPLMAAAEGWPEDGWITPWRPV